MDGIATSFLVFDMAFARVRNSDIETLVRTTIVLLVVFRMLARSIERVGPLR